MTSRDHEEHTESPDYDEAELDMLLETVSETIHTKLEAGFAPQAGLADVYARVHSSAAVPASPSTRPPTDPLPRRAAVGPEANRRLQEVCDRIDILDFCLSSAANSAQQEPFAGAAFLEEARLSLQQLRSGLANRALGKPKANQFLQEVESHLEQADRILRTHHTTLDDVLSRRIPGQIQSGGSVLLQLQVICEQVIRLYDEADVSGATVLV